MLLCLLVILLFLPIPLLRFGKRATHANLVKKSYIPESDQKLRDTRWTGWITCVLPLVRVLLIPFEASFGGPNGSVYVFLFIVTLATGILSIGLFTLNARGKERTFGIIAGFVCILSGTGVFMAGLAFTAQA